MKLNMSRTIYCAIILILLEGLISTSQTEVSPSTTAVKKDGSAVAASINGTDVTKNNSSVPVPAVVSVSTKKVPERTLYVPDRSPPGMNPEEMKDESFIAEENDSDSTGTPGQGADNKAVQRALIVMAGIALIVVAYLGIKFFLIKKKKVVKRYGRIEASEMDLLDEIEDDDESEEEELFDINKQRRS